ncbi:uncharacterized protein BXZ73DRAFT_92391 [Epithele typhae]|uniref:uncharacterized protein n=1 Tax=Epithele typhae TaxID=378194 RepID=UPI0020077F68|nr:uncharacterized protein BXZ73DRAFT_92391 [Epithele typhae]KAH9917114.1 hypothetical protein BXZ73DRAFT_92391 [Epithele typhae]
MSGLLTIRDFIAELNRQATEHQGRRLRLIKQITTDPSYQSELKRLQESCGWDTFHGGSESWRVFLEPKNSENAVQARFNPSVNALMTQVHMNEASLSCIRARIEALSTFLHPVLRLPSEVLVHIFKLGSRMPQEDPILGASTQRPFILVAAAICRHWREIATTTPDLWTNIVVKHPRPYGWVPLCLVRSADQPIDITIDCRSTNLLTATIVDGLVSQLMVHILRWRRFALNTTDPATIYAIGHRLREARAPSLRHLQLSLSGSSGNQEVLLPEILQGGAEALTSVRYDSLCTPWNSRPLVNLTMLDLRWLWLQTRLQYEQFAKLLAASPSITALVLRGTYIHLHSGRQYPPLSIPTLRYLEVSGDNVCRMSSILETPNLVELTLANLDETEFREFVASLPVPGETTITGNILGPRYPRLHSLSLLNASMCTPTRRFTRALPTVTHLTVINSATAKFLQLFREDLAERTTYGLSWPNLRKFTFIDEVDYFHLYGVIRERAAAGAPLQRLVFNSPFIHDDNLVVSLEELVKVDIVKDVDLDH